MFWQEKGTAEKNRVEVVDVSFKANARCLPVDHAYKLYLVIARELPWIKSDKHAAIHLIYGAGSGNGWERPEQEDGSIYLSRRTRFTIRAHKTRVDEIINRLDGLEANIDDHELKFGEPHVKELSEHTTIFARNVVDKVGEEEEFLSSIVDDLKKININVKKIICGKQHTLEFEKDSKLKTRSIMLADLSASESLQLQASGLGKYQFMGCGVFLPYKTCEAVPVD